MKWVSNLKLLCVILIIIICIGRHRVFQGHGGKELMSADCQPQGTCGDVLTSGDVLVILPGQNSKCMVYTFYVSRAV